MEESRGAKIKLGPLIELRGQFDSKGLGERPMWTNVYVMAMPGRVRLTQCLSMGAKLRLKLPAGDYRLLCYGTDTKDESRNVTLTADKPTVDLGTIDLKPTIIAQHYGKTPPEISATDARGVKKSVTLARTRGTTMKRGL